MLKSLLKLSHVAVLVTAVVGAPIALLAQDATTNKPAAKPIATPHIPFHGKLDAVDNTAKTITVHGHVIQITSETIIKKDGKPAMLADGVVGENVSGSIKRTADGKSFEALSVYFGQKAKAAAPASNTKTNTP
jgi:hypothetical protein